jgi:hypothetical protein
MDWEMILSANVFLLLEPQALIDPGRPRPLTRLKNRKSQTHRPFENREEAAPRKIKGCATRRPKVSLWEVKREGTCTQERRQS